LSFACQLSLFTGMDFSAAGTLGIPDNETLFYQEQPTSEVFLLCDRFDPRIFYHFSPAGFDSYTEINPEPRQ
jgi:hypothetical protein